MPNQNEIRQQITNSIIESLKSGTIPWKQPWSMDPNAGRPRNGATSRPYNGVNILLLMLHNHRHRLTSRHFATYNQWQALGGQVMRRPSDVPKGKWGCPIIFWKKVTKNVTQDNGDYQGWRYVAKKVRQACDLHPAKRAKRLPRIMNGDEFRRFYTIVDRAEDVQHALMLRLLFFTMVRVSELCKIEVADVDLDTCKIRVNQGKGSKDRYVLFGKSFATALRTHMAAHPHNRYLFQTRRATKFSTRRVQQIVKKYAEEAGVQATPHTFRHQAITWLTRNSGMADAELQLITGHARRETLAIYQHVALDEELERKYHETMKDLDL